MDVRFRALMWAIAAVLAVVIVIHSAPKPKAAHPGPHSVSPLAARLRGRP